MIHSPAERAFAPAARRGDGGEVLAARCASLKDSALLDKSVAASWCLPNR